MKSVRSSRISFVALFIGMATALIIAESGAHIALTGNIQRADQKFRLEF